MNIIDFSHSGGFPLETDTLNFLQNGFIDPIKALTALGGNNYIISGVVETNGKVSDGWVVINGEVLPFKGDFKQSTVIVTRTAKTAHFEDGSEHEVYFTRQAIFGTGLESIPFASMTRISDLQQQKKCIDDLQSAHDAYKEQMAKQTSELQSAHDTLKIRVSTLEKGQFVKGMILAWSGSIDSIPAGWQLCEKLKDRFILGAGGKYAVGKKDGAEEVTLTVEQMPEHTHHYTTPSYTSTSDNVKGNGRGLWSLTETTSYPTTRGGGNKAHNNMPPYYTLAYIEYVGYEVQS
ncbi:MAG: hypothetical protein E6Q66_05800 [Pedobacter sp.]|nr:MAG: hypothetical protein E6Q66_05800 [Pedobacter sp.]